MKTRVVEKFFWVRRRKAKRVGVVVLGVMMLSGPVWGVLYLYDNSVPDWYGSGLVGMVPAGNAPTKLDTKRTYHGTTYRNKIYVSGAGDGGPFWLAQGDWGGAQWTVPAGEIVTEVVFSGNYRSDTHVEGYGLFGGLNAANEKNYYTAALDWNNYQVSYGPVTVAVPYADRVTQLQFRPLWQIGSGTGYTYGYPYNLPENGNYCGEISSIKITTREVMRSSWFTSLGEIDRLSSLAQAGAKCMIVYLRQTFNVNDTVQYQAILDYLDTAQANNVKVILGINELVATSPLDTAKLTALVNVFRNHPALEGWYTWDEPSADALTNCQNAYTTIKALSNKPIYICFSTVGLDGNLPYTFRNALDVVLFDSYPFPTGSSEFFGLEDTVTYDWWDIFHMNPYTTKGWKSRCEQIRSQAQSAARPFQMILQGFGKVPWAGLTNRLPTWTEERFMLHYSLFKNAEEISYWAEFTRTDSEAVSTDPYPYNGNQWLTDVCSPLMEELGGYRPALIRGSITNGVSDNQSNVFSNVYLNPANGEYYLLSINTVGGTRATTFTLNLPSQFRYAVPINENSGTITIQNNVFSNSFSSYQVHNYRLVP